MNLFLFYIINKNRYCVKILKLFTKRFTYNIFHQFIFGVRRYRLTLYSFLKSSYLHPQTHVFLSHDMYLLYDIKSRSWSHKIRDFGKIYVKIYLEYTSSSPIENPSDFNRFHSSDYVFQDDDYIINCCLVHERVYIFTSTTELMCNKELVIIVHFSF